jgi:hypothetical protein
MYTPLPIHAHTHTHSHTHAHTHAHTHKHTHTHLLSYIPDASETLKYAWMQYISVLVVIYLIADWFRSNTVIASHRGKTSHSGTVTALHSERTSHSSGTALHTAPRQ